MTNEEILERLVELFEDVLDEEDLQLSEETKADDIEAWDSLTHIQIVVGVEREFKIRFQSQEIEGFKNVGDMIKSIQAKA